MASLSALANGRRGVSGVDMNGAIVQSIPATLPVQSGLVRASDGDEGYCPDETSTETVGWGVHPDQYTRGTLHQDVAALIAGVDPYPIPSWLKRQKRKLKKSAMRLLPMSYQATQPSVVSISSPDIQINIYQPLESFSNSKNLELVDKLNETRDALAAEATHWVKNSCVGTGGELYAYNHVDPVSEDTFYAVMSPVNVSQRHELCIECNSIGLLGADSALNKVKGTPKAYKVVLKGLKVEYEEGVARIEVAKRVMQYKGVGRVYATDQGLLKKVGGFEVIGHRPPEADRTQVEDYDPTDINVALVRSQAVPAAGTTGITSKMSATVVAGETAATGSSVAVTRSSIAAMTACFRKRPASAMHHDPTADPADEKKPRLS